MKKNIVLIILYCVLLFSTLSSSESAIITLEAENPIFQQGSQGRGEKSAASGGEVLGSEFGSKAGHFAEYKFELEKTLSPALISILYARALNGSGWMDVSIDDEPAGRLEYSNTGGWGNNEQDFKWSSVQIPELKKGKHILRLTIQKPELKMTFPEIPIQKSPILDLIGNRNDKNSVGHGKNVALYTGNPSKFYYATHKLGDIFSAVNGTTIKWFPDHVLVTPDINIGTSLNINLDQITISTTGKSTEHPDEKTAKSKLIEQWQVCVTKDDVVVSIVHLTNSTDKKIIHKIEIIGDCRNSKDWRGETGGDKIMQKKNNFVILKDKNVFPGILPDGLCMAIGGNTKPKEIIIEPAGTYNILYE
ncbi:MAG: hypothetical protein KAW92_04175, partial [Candidatus Cloacimonetes bacterium]|nr:hypothetical protein [Candidatus Cloacimonadota bacterium]